MESDQEHIMRQFEQEQGQTAVDSNRDVTSIHQQESGAELWSDAEKDDSPAKAREGQANGVLKQTSRVVRQAIAKYHPYRVACHDEVEDILAKLKTVEKHMHRLRRYIDAQEDGGKPLYRWAAYEGYPALNTSVSKLKKAMSKCKATRLPQEYLHKSVTRANDFSTSVSTASGDIFAAINKKVGEYQDELEASALSDDAKTQATAVITGEVFKLIEHATSATGTVWQAHDLLRTCEQRLDTWGWAWSVGATILTATIATAISLATVYFYSPAQLHMLPAHGGGHPVCSKLVDLVQQSQVVANLTGEVYKLKFQDIDNKYTDLVTWSEANGLRIDGIVDGLGPPNEEGTYFVSSQQTSKSEDGSCEERCQKASGDLQVQLQQQQQELQDMRKNINRLDIRLLRGLERGRKE